MAPCSHRGRDDPVRMVDDAAVEMAGPPRIPGPGPGSGSGSGSQGHPPRSASAAVSSRGTLVRELGLGRHGHDRRILDEEAAFADAEYARHAGRLGLNQRYFQKFAVPRHDWDWRRSVPAARRGAGMQGPRPRLRDGRGVDVPRADGCRGDRHRHLTGRGAADAGAGRGQRCRGPGPARCMRCDPTSFPDETFDVVHGFGILHHIGLGAGMREVKRLLKPGGRASSSRHGQLRAHRAPATQGRSLHRAAGARSPRPRSRR